MGRRALRKIDADLDLSWHLREFDSLTAPFMPAEMFQHDAPLEVEVGCGKGLFMSTASGDLPDRNFIGIEIARKYASFAAARLAKAARDNAFLIHGDAQKFFHDHLSSESLDAVHVYFPDPWWKKRHRKRRIMNEAFLLDVYRVLKADGRLHFWTDVKEYFDEALELMREKIPLSGPQHVEEKASAHNLDYRTHFERRMRLHNEPVYRSEFSKTVRETL
ncbi:MAG: tRNA (guanosine(46)-N7)-methyltransferase TrmB [Pirellulaceae bacterium]|nr:tRNA (guanosine(46)-N7)-methyltransferase TrmB [Pirellulaceae bacterium]